MSFPTEKFYVSHFTGIGSLEEIIKSRSLQPPKVQREVYLEENPGEEWEGSNYYENAKERGGDIDKYDKSVFYSILFPDSNGKPTFRKDKVERIAYFIFSPQIIEDNAKMVGRRGVTEPPVFCKGWSYGKIKNEKCNYYDSSKSLQENLDSWRTIMLPMIQKFEEDPFLEKLVQAESKALNAELLMEGEMPIDMDLLYIYIPQGIEFNYTEEQIKKYPFLKNAMEGRKIMDEKLERLIRENPDLPWTHENPFE
jgi:hypothetical protein